MSEEPSQSIGERIKAARVEQGLSRREVGEALSLNDQYLYQLESGRRAIPLEQVWSLACHLGIDPHSLDARLAPVRRKPTGRG